MASADHTLLPGLMTRAAIANNQLAMYTMIASMHAAAARLRKPA